MRTTSLTPDQIREFIERGYVVSRGAIPREIVDDWFEWSQKRVTGWKEAHQKPMPPFIRLAPMLKLDVREFAPAIAGAACDLLGGWDRIADNWDLTDGFFVSSSTVASGTSTQEAHARWKVPPAKKGGWHIDGDWFRHFADSPEWNLTALISWTDSKPFGGTTLVADGSAAKVSRYLLEHPEGVDEFDFEALLGESFAFTQIEMSAGDVLFMHPHLVHCSSPNVSAATRVISSCMFDCASPLRLGPGEPHSPVEIAILHAAGCESAAYRRTRETRYFRTPPRVLEYVESRKLEREVLRRLA
jgi:Phytanoyl-CoA dioxygenase (PhyH)